MKNTGLLSISINGESYRNDQREDNSHKGKRKVEDRDRKRDRKDKDKRDQK